MIEDQRVVARLCTHMEICTRGKGWEAGNASKEALEVGCKGCTYVLIIVRPSTDNHSHALQASAHKSKSIVKHGTITVFVICALVTLAQGATSALFLRHHDSSLPYSGESG